MFKSKAAEQEHCDNGCKNHYTVGEVEKLHLGGKISQDEGFYESDSKEAED